MYHIVAAHETAGSRGPPGSCAQPGTTGHQAYCWSLATVLHMTGWTLCQEATRLSLELDLLTSKSGC